MPARVRAVILGGYGNFGALIGERLRTVPGVEVVIAGRDERRAAAFAARLGVTAATLDIDDPRFEDRLRVSAPDLVVNAIGPYQGRDYRIAAASVAQGAHYADLADTRAHVAGIGSLDAPARARQVLVVSGASTVPALSAAVVDRYRGDFAELHGIDYAISTSRRVPGVGTVRGVLARCGRLSPGLRAGRPTQTHGWAQLRWHRFGGGVGWRLLADCDVPDLELFPHRYPELRELRFRAGTQSAVQVLTLNLLARAVRRGWLQSPDRHATVLHALARAMGVVDSGLSAMFMDLRGIDQAGRAHAVRWELTARRNHGAYVPCLAVVALARKLASGRLPVRGAMPCMGLIGLDEYLREARELEISAGLR